MKCRRGFFCLYFFVPLTCEKTIFQSPGKIKQAHIAKLYRAKTRFEQGKKMAARYSCLEGFCYQTHTQFINTAQSEVLFIGDFGKVHKKVLKF